jgi:triosephosphate isomerase (TIM)
MRDQKMSLRKTIVAGNWKMHKNASETDVYFSRLIPFLKTLKPALPRIVIFPPAINLLTAKNSSSAMPIEIGAQNCHFETKGAFTGEISTSMLRDSKIDWCLVGHSERRSLFHETDAETGKKVLSCLQNGIKPMLCVGESLDERKAGATKEVILRQLRAGLALVDQHEARNEMKNGDLADSLAIAYEPVWAIGTGLVATPEQANEAHLFLRQELAALFSTELAQNISILYGGSVKADNAGALMKLSEIDGFLVGGASLEPESIAAICEIAAMLPKYT